VRVRYKGPEGTAVGEATVLVPGKLTSVLLLESTTGVSAGCKLTVPGSLEDLLRRPGWKEVKR
jgi:hypothetical protein